MNLVVLNGRLTRDPELKFGQSGKAYSRFSIAVDRPFQSSSDKNSQTADFINCVAFGKTGELVGEYLRKGRMAGVQGRIQTDVYEANGEKRYTTSVHVEKIEFLESKGNSEPSFEKPYEKQVENKAAAPTPDIDFEYDEFPF